MSRERLGQIPIENPLTAFAFVATPAHDKKVPLGSVDVVHLSAHT
jgi:hypothetical protein